MVDTTYPAGITQGPFPTASKRAYCQASVKVCPAEHETSNANRSDVSLVGGGWRWEAPAPGVTGMLWGSAIEAGCRPLAPSGHSHPGEQPSHFSRRRAPTLPGHPRPSSRGDLTSQSTLGQQAVIMSLEMQMVVSTARLNTEPAMQTAPVCPERGLRSDGKASARMRAARAGCFPG